MPGTIWCWASLGVTPRTPRVGIQAAWSGEVTAHSLPSLSLRWEVHVPSSSFKGDRNTRPQSLRAHTMQKTKQQQELRCKLHLWPILLPFPLLGRFFFKVAMIS